MVIVISVVGTVAPDPPEMIKSCARFSCHAGITKLKIIGFRKLYIPFVTLNDFADFTKLQEVFVAFTKDRKRLVSISDKILIADKAKK